jgi:hypothetical protein
LTGFPGADFLDGANVVGMVAAGKLERFDFTIGKFDGD